MQIEDLEVHTAAAPPNPITQVTLTGFQFTPRHNYYQTFQYGTSAKLAVGSIYIYQSSASASASIASHISVHYVLEVMQKGAHSL